MDTAENTIALLPCWKSDIEIESLSGGITNKNFRVTDSGSDYFVRLGDDIPVHGVMRFNELNASLAAHKAGISPKVIHHQVGVLVLEFIFGETLNEQHFKDSKLIAKATDLVRACHMDISSYLTSPVLTFWVFQVVKQYTSILQSGGSRMIPQLSELCSFSNVLSKAVGKIDLVFGHNDLLPANFIDDGERLWLIDWDYAGFNSPLFDLGGLASNNSFNQQQEMDMLERYYQAKPDADLIKSYYAMKCASLLRESMWSMVSELHSEIDFDFQSYTEENLNRFRNAYEDFLSQFG